MSDEGIETSPSLCPAAQALTRPVAIWQATQATKPEERRLLRWNRRLQKRRNAAVDAADDDDGNDEGDLMI